MTREEVIEAFCALSEQVMSKKFRGQRAADCFCGNNATSLPNFQYEPEVMQYIEDAVYVALRNERTQP